ncbi:hypothetical protein GLYMA_01G153967v4 [Glycine max]|nr:hypothetical protein GLYMA_01G153967v4 [Glycine max]KAH1163246.1 hypothetical protein GYH30_001672 [Glycine max]
MVLILLSCIGCRFRGLGRCLGWLGQMGLGSPLLLKFWPGN